MKDDTAPREAEPDLLKVSKFLSFVLRHRPEEIDLTLNKEGWAKTADLLDKAQRAGVHLTQGLLEEIVRSDKKGRYGLSEDGSRIRAVQGHSSSQVALSMKKTVPPRALYHGTAARHLAAIQKEGLVPQSRHHVHLSADVDTAITVGMRHAKKHSELVILVVDCNSMLTDGGEFFMAENGVWLANAVPAKYISTVPLPDRSKRRG